MPPLPFSDHDLLLAESTFDVISYHKLDGRILYVSRASRELLGYEPDEIVGNEGDQLIHPEDFHVLSDAITRMRADHRDCLTVYRLRHKEGHYVWVETSNRLIADPATGEQHIVCVTRDITARKEAEQAARQSQERLESAIRGAEMGFWTLDIDKAQLLGEANFDTLLDMQSDRAPTTFDSWLDYTHPDDVDKVKQTFEEYRQGTRDEHEMEMRLRSESGRWVWILSRGRVVERDESGRAIRAAGTSLDITSRHETEDALAEAKQAAEAANRAKSEFLANVSHEIRTPMTAILGYTEWLLSLEQPDEQQRRAIEVVHRHANALLRLINDILDLSKIEADKIEPVIIECSPWQLASEAIELMKIRANEKGLPLTLEFQPPLPRTIRTDAARVRQVLVNLLGNAVKFSSQGTVRLIVGLTESPDGRRLIAFTVSDQGVGMTPEEIERVFHPFEQLDSSTRRRFGGSGLGLTISRRLAALLGGEISVESEPRHGSRFTLTIDPGSLDGVPMDHHPPAADAQPQRKENGVAVPERLDGRVLLAEDGRDVRLLLKQLLERVGLDVDTAENGRIAYEMALGSRDAGRPYDLILMDIQMPELDGNDAMRQLRQNDWHRPILAVTAHAMTGDAEAFRAAGFDDHIPKPVRYEQLLRCIAWHLGQLEENEGNGNDRPARRNDVWPVTIQYDDQPAGEASSATDDAPRPIGFGYLSPEDVEQLTAQFAAELPERAKKLEEALRRGDCGELGSVAHQLKGAAAMHGFNRIMQSAQAVCQKAGLGHSADQLGRDVRHVVQLCHAAANQYIVSEEP